MTNALDASMNLAVGFTTSGAEEIVTGGASGIGYQAGLALATEGANVVRPA